MDSVFCLCEEMYNYYVYFFCRGLIKNLILLINFLLVRWLCFFERVGKVKYNWEMFFGKDNNKDCLCYDVIVFEYILKWLIFLVLKCKI